LNQKQNIIPTQTGGKLRREREFILYLEKHNKCRRNHQDTYKYVNDEPVAGNYYPVNAHLAIKVGLMMGTLLNPANLGREYRSGVAYRSISRRLVAQVGPVGVDGRTG
jgi:hypothetical protein